MSPERKPGQLSIAARCFLAVMLVAVLVGGLGFVYKLMQFIRETRGGEGAAFVIPLLVYFSMALAFICLLGWAITRGMFHDVERPKYRMLEREQEYDRDGR